MAVALGLDQHAAPLAEQGNAASPALEQGAHGLRGTGGAGRRWCQCQARALHRSRLQSTAMRGHFRAAASKKAAAAATCANVHAALPARFAVRCKRGEIWYLQFLGKVSHPGVTGNVTRPDDLGHDVQLQHLLTQGKFSGCSIRVGSTDLCGRGHHCVRGQPEQQQ